MNDDKRNLGRKLIDLCIIEGDEEACRVLNKLLKGER